MSVIDAVLAEMEEEARATRKLFERVPEDKLSWKPHPKSFTLGQLALHIAQLPGNIPAIAALDVFEAPSFQARPEAKSRQELLQVLDRGLATAKEVLSKFDAQKLAAPWVLQKDGQALMTLPRVYVLRSILLNHNYHHRGQLTVYLRLLDVPLPSVYGPSADQNPFAA